MMSLLSTSIGYRHTCEYLNYHKLLKFAFYKYVNASKTCVL